MNTEQIKNELRKTRKRLQIPTKDLLSSGSTVLNLACSGKASGAFGKGFSYYFIGDSSSGKSISMMTVLAEACINPIFDNYQLIYDDVEHGVLFDVRKFWPALAKSKRLEMVHSTSLEGFYDSLDAAIDRGPCIWVADSMDALQPRAERKKSTANRKARQQGKEEKGSYGTDKAKINSSRYREAVNRLQENGSILFVISQTRDNIGFGAQFNPKTRSGGNALTFYSTLELWTSVRENISSVVLGKKRQQGIITRIKIKKNRHIGGVRIVDIPILWGHGIDDVGGCIDYLIDEGVWKDSKGVIQPEEFNFKGKREKLIEFIEKGNLEKDLQEIVTTAWQKIDDACTVERKNKYE